MSGLVRVSNPIIAYHGSPHKFDQFDIAHIGNGEGAQAYGHGLYFAGNEKVALGYRDALTPDGNARLFGKTKHQIRGDGKYTIPIAAAEALLRAAGYEAATGDAEDARRRAIAEVTRDGRRLNDVYDSAVRDPGHPQHHWAKEQRQFLQDQNAATVAHLKGVDLSSFQPPVRGSLYKVALHVDPHSLIDWDKPISEQSPKIQNAASHLYQMGKKDLRFGQKLQPQGVDESAILENLGVAGLKYLDAGSRKAGDGTRNYVMFHHDPVEMLERRAIGGTVAKRAYGGHVNNLGRNADNVFWIKNWDDQEAPVVKNPTKRDLMSMTKVPKAADKDSWRHASLGYLITPHGHSYVFPSAGLIHDTVVHALRGKFQEPGFNDYQSSWAEAGEKPKTGDVKVGGIYRTGEDQFHSDDLDDLSQLMRGRRQRARGGHIHMKHPRHAKIHTGPIRSGVAGRTDHLPLHVPQGSYVIPADIISSMGEGNSEAGFKVAKSIFSAPIYGQKKLGSGNPYNANGLPYGMPSPRAAGGRMERVQTHPDHPGWKVTRATEPGNQYMQNARVTGPDGEDVTVPAGAVSKHMGEGVPVGAEHWIEAAERYLAAMPRGMKRADGGATETVPVVVAGGEWIIPPEDVLRIGRGDLARGHKILDDFVLGQRAKTIKVLKRLPGPARD